jgi:hypothetical protein
LQVAERGKGQPGIRASAAHPFSQT